MSPVARSLQNAHIDGWEGIAILKKLSIEEERLLSNSELLEYYKNLRQYYKNLPMDIINIKMKEFIHPILLNLVKIIFRKKQIILHKENLPSKSQTCIYACNHSNGYDFPTVAKTVKSHFHILADFTMQNDKFVDFLNRINGVIYVNRKDKKSRNKAKDRMIQLLINGKNILIFPEGTWNLTESLPMLPLNWGIIDISKISGCPIIPIVIEYKDKENVVNIGKPMYISLNDDKADKINELRDIMSTLKWEIWEQYPIESRKNIPETYYKDFLAKTLKTYKKFDIQYESSVILSRETNYDKVFAPIKELKINKNNAFLLNRK